MDLEQLNLDISLKKLLRRISAEIIDYRTVLETPPSEILEEMRNVRSASLAKESHVFSTPYEQNKLFIIKIPKIALEALAKENDYYSRKLTDDALTLLDELVKAKEYEKSMRIKNPAIKQAWEQYITLLSLAAENEIDTKFDFE